MLGITGQNRFQWNPKWTEPDTSFVWHELKHGKLSENLKAYYVYFFQVQDKKAKSVVDSEVTASFQLV